MLFANHIDCAQMPIVQQAQEVYRQRLSLSLSWRHCTRDPAVYTLYMQSDCGKWTLVNE